MRNNSSIAIENSNKSNLEVSKRMHDADRPRVSMIEKLKRLNSTLSNPKASPELRYVS